MAATGGSLAFGIGCISPCEDLGVLPQGVRSVVGPNGKHGRETKLQLLASHGLKRDLEVERADGYDRMPLPWVNDLHMSESTFPYVDKCFNKGEGKTTRYV